MSYAHKCDEHKYHILIDVFKRRNDQNCSQETNGNSTNGNLIEMGGHLYFLHIEFTGVSHISRFSSIVTRSGIVIIVGGTRKEK